MSQEDSYFSRVMMSSSLLDFDLTPFMNEDDDDSMLSGAELERYLEVDPMVIDVEPLDDELDLFGSSSIHETSQLFNDKAATSSAAEAVSGPLLDSLSQVIVNPHVTSDCSSPEAAAYDFKSRRKSALGQRNFDGDEEKEEAPQPPNSKRCPRRKSTSSLQSPSSAPKLVAPKRTSKMPKPKKERQPVKKMWMLNVKEHPESKNAVLARKRRETKKLLEIQLKDENQLLKHELEDEDKLVERVRKMGYTVTKLQP